MGFIIDTESNILGLERRRESYGICDLQRKYQAGKTDPRERYQSEHIFAYADGEIEISNEFLLELIAYFLFHPEEMAELRKRK